MSGAAARGGAGRRMAVTGALVALGGILLSGPLAVGLLALIRRPGSWRGAAEFADQFSRMDVLPFFFGFVLVIGYVMLFAGLHEIAPDDARPRATAALVFTSAYAALATLNYLTQTTFIPAVARRYGSQYEGVVDAFSIANPRSLAWAIELWSYALLGAASWLAAAVFGETRQQRWLRALMIVNGIVSIGAALTASADMSWITSTAGFAAYAAWNALMAAISILTVLVLTPSRAAR